MFLGGAAALWPLAGRTQQPARMRRVTVMTGHAAGDPEAQRQVAAFLQGAPSVWMDRGADAVIDESPERATDHKARGQIRYSHTQEPVCTEEPKPTRALPPQDSHLMPKRNNLREARLRSRNESRDRRAERIVIMPTTVWGRRKNL
jgi:hypothetical protein